MAIEAVKKLLQKKALDNLDDAAVIAAVNELIADHATFKTVVDDIKALVNSIRLKLQGCYILSSPTFTVVGGDKPKAATAAFYYMLGGKLYLKAAVAAGTAPGNDVIPQNKFGAVAFDIGADGTIDVIEAAANAAGYDSAALAIAGIPQAAGGHARMGTLTAMDVDGAFTFGTSDLDHAGATIAFTDGQDMIAAMEADVGTSTPPALTATTITMQET